MKILSLLLMCLMLSSCAFHFQNQKGIKASAKDVQTQYGNIDDGNAYYWSQIDFWFPWKMKDREGIK